MAIIAPGAGARDGSRPPARSANVREPLRASTSAHELRLGGRDITSPSATPDQQEVIHPEAVREAADDTAGEEDLAYLADTFQILANETRLRVVEALARRELCVRDLAAAVGSSPSAVSHHLRQLRQMKLVRYRKDGRMAYYRLDDDHVSELFRLGLEHVRE